ncbi:MAG: glycoside hydrolase family 26 protein [Defluviitaleaceae bacterium]|nr:glycoside hydrolase family 26 protein [Defluviitaleaceae bacterium]
MKSYKKILTILSFAMFLQACNTASGVATLEVEANPIEADKAFDISGRERLNIYFEREITLSVYEPKAGVYLGAYILSNRYINFNIANFEAAAGREHSIYMYHKQIGDSFPQEFILSCIANLKAPYIVLSPEDPSNPFRTDKIAELAKNFGSFFVPTFIELYPSMRTNGYNPQEFIEFYRYVREVFRRHATNVAFVFSICESEIPDFLEYYPGDDYVDWIALNVTRKIDDDGNPSFLEDDVFNKINFVYHTFQERKPMILNLAISHFSTFNHVYHSMTAGREIERIYTTIAQSYPRIRAINYLDYNSANPVNRPLGRDNFSITGNQTVLSYYQNVIDSEKFLSELDFSTGGEKILIPIKSAFSGYRILGEYYISENILRLELNFDKVFDEFIEINGKKYINISLLGCNYEVIYDKIIFKS